MNIATFDPDHGLTPVRNRTKRVLTRPPLSQAALPLRTGRFGQGRTSLYPPYRGERGIAGLRPVRLPGSGARSVLL